MSAEAGDAAAKPAAAEPADEAQRIGVKELAEFVHRRGDIHYRYEMSALAQEGIARQKAYQQQRDATYRREVPVAAEYAGLRVTGRIDGWDPARRQVEEVKTTRADPRVLHERIGAVHDAQLALYGAMLALGDEALQTLTLRLVYLHPDTPDAVAFAEERCRDELIGFFQATCGAYADWLAEVHGRIDLRNERLRRAAFPYGRFRMDQRRLAKHVYRGFRDGVDWLLEAPTGSGKTMACVFPALKAMGEGELDRVLFLTARTTGARAAEDAFEDAARGAALAVTVTAKERICFNPGTPCDPDLCEFAAGYFDRMPAARRELLGEAKADRPAIEAAARRHRVCPHALSLDAAEWADAVICDYSHVFDPVVALKRLQNAVFARVGLIVDEAHQLGDRVRDMLGMTLRRALVKAALAEDGVAAPLAKALRSVDRALADLARTTRPAEDPEAERPIPAPLPLQRAVDRFLTAFSETRAAPDAPSAVGDAHFEMLRFRRACDWAEEEGAFHFLAHGTGRAFCVELVCTVPGGHIQRTMEPFHGSVRLSGTLTPPHVFQRLHGFTAASPAMQSDGDGDAARLGVFVVPDISTYYRDRERTLPALAALIEGVCGASGGNYLVALPSFEYAALAAGACAAPSAFCQRPDMDLAEREAFIDALGEPAGRIAFVVLGGVFTESVDFDGRALHGIIVVGPGLPPRSLRRDLIAADSVAEGVANDGDELAYRQPAMTRVVQAVGRIARAPTERGVAVLVDPRFRQSAYSAFLPQRWPRQTVRACEAAGRVRAFWDAAL